MPDLIKPLPNLDNVDLRLLKVFLAVVNHGGFSAAQSELNISQPSISSRMSQLESRLGVHLCERGRSGFKLTREGEEVYRAATRLFDALEQFRSDVGSTRGQLIGNLHIAIVDAVLTNTACRLDEAIRLFNATENDVQIHLSIEAPQNIQLGLMQERFHIGLAAFRNLPQTLGSHPIYTEQQNLYCAEGHPLFAMSDDDITAELIANAHYVRQLDMQDWTPPGGQSFSPKAATADVETMAALVLSGGYIGYMPGHYARRWLDKNKLRVIKPDSLSYVSDFYIAYRVADRSNVTRRFVECLRETAVSNT